MIRRHHFPVWYVAANCLLAFGTANAQLKSTGVGRYDVAVAKAVAILQTMPPPRERATSLVAYALLKAGVDVSDPRLDRGVQEAVRRCLLYTSPSPRDLSTSRMPSSA